MRLGLTKRQRQLLDFLTAEEAAGRCPSFEEIAAHLGLRSKSGPHRLISGLEERGYVRRLPHKARAIALVREPAEIVVPAPVAPAERPRLGIPKPVADRLVAYCGRRHLAARDVLAAALTQYMERHP